MRSPWGGAGWTIHANVAAPLILTPRETYGHWNVSYGQDAGIHTYDIETHPAITRLSVESDDSLVHAQLQPVAATAHRYVLTVSLDEKLLLRDGDFDAEVAITAYETNDAPAASPTLLKINGRASGPVHASPSEINFGVVNAGQELMETVTLLRTEHADGKFHIANVRASKDVTVKQLPLPQEAPDAVALLQVKIGEVAAGQHHSSVTVALGQTGTDTDWEVVIPIGYYLPAP